MNDTKPLTMQELNEIRNVIQTVVNFPGWRICDVFLDSELSKKLPELIKRIEEDLEWFSR